MSPSPRLPRLDAVALVNILRWIELEDLCRIAETCRALRCFTASVDAVLAGRRLSTVSFYAVWWRAKPRPSWSVWNRDNAGQWRECRFTGDAGAKGMLACRTDQLVSASRGLVPLMDVATDSTDLETLAFATSVYRDAQEVAVCASCGKVAAHAHLWLPS